MSKSLEAVKREIQERKDAEAQKKQAAIEKAQAESQASRAERDEPRQQRFRLRDEKMKADREAKDAALKARERTNWLAAGGDEESFERNWPSIRDEAIKQQVRNVRADQDLHYRSRW